MVTLPTAIARRGASTRSSTRPVEPSICAGKRDQKDFPRPGARAAAALRELLVCVTMREACCAGPALELEHQLDHRLRPAAGSGYVGHRQASGSLGFKRKRRASATRCCFATRKGIGIVAEALGEADRARACRAAVLIGAGTARELRRGPHDVFSSATSADSNWKDWDERLGGPHCARASSSSAKRSPDLEVERIRRRRSNRRDSRAGVDGPEPGGGETMATALARGDSRSISCRMRGSFSPLRTVLPMRPADTYRSRCNRSAATSDPFHDAHLCSRSGHALLPGWGGLPGGEPSSSTASPCAA